MSCTASQRNASKASNVDLGSTSACKAINNIDGYEKQQEKCVIVNELLCYIWNHHQTMRIDELCKVGAAHFTHEAIINAKELLFSFCEGIRMSRRRNDEENIADMIKLMNSSAFLDNRDLPVFAAMDLSKLPSIQPFHVDTLQMVNTIKSHQGDILQNNDLLKAVCEELMSIRKSLAEVSSIREQLVSTQSELKSTVSELREMREKVDLLSKSGGSEVCTGRTNPTTKALSYAAAAKAKKPVKQLQQELSIASASRSNPELHVCAALNAMSQGGKRGNVTEVRSQDKKFANMEKSDGDWTTVRRKRSTPIIGNKWACKLASVAPKRSVTLFVSRCMPDTKEEDLKSFLASTFRARVEVLKLKTKFDTYASFKVTLVFSDLSLDAALCMAADPANWPEGLLVRRFFGHARTRRDSATGVHHQQQQWRCN